MIVLTGLLLKSLVTSVDLTCKWVRFCMSINMFNQILFLSKTFITYSALILFELEMNCNKMSCQPKLTCKVFTAYCTLQVFFFTNIDFRVYHIIKLPLVLMFYLELFSFFVCIKLWGSTWAIEVYVGSFFYLFDFIGDIRNWAVASVVLIYVLRLQYLLKLLSVVWGVI